VDTSLCTSYLPRRLPSGRATITVPSVTSPTSAATAAAAFAKDSVAWVQPERGVIAGHGEALRRVIKSPFSGFFVAMLQLADMAMALLVLWFLFGDEEWTLLVVSFAALVGSAVVFLIVEAIRLNRKAKRTRDHVARDQRKARSRGLVMCFVCLWPFAMPFISWQRMRMAASNHRRSHRAWGSFTKAFFSYDPWTAHFDSESTQEARVGSFIARFVGDIPQVAVNVIYVTSKGAEGLGALFAWVGIGIASFLILREILWSSRELKKAFASEHTDLDIREADERDKARFLTPTMTPASTHRLDPSSNV